MFHTLNFFVVHILEDVIYFVLDHKKLHTWLVPTYPGYQVDDRTTYGRSLTVVDFLTALIVIFRNVNHLFAIGSLLSRIQ